jgi:hypothetical protein
MERVIAERIMKCGRRHANKFLIVHRYTLCISALLTKRKSDYLRLRKLVIELVLSTDMKHHFSLQGQFASAVRLPNPAAAAKAALGDHVLQERARVSGPLSRLSGPLPRRSRMLGASLSQIGDNVKAISTTDVVVVMPAVLQDPAPVMIPEVTDSERLLSLQVRAFVGRRGQVQCRCV